MSSKLWTLACILVFLGITANALQCYVQYCRCAGSDIERDNQEKNLDKDNCGCDSLGSGKIAECEAKENEESKPVCVEVSNYNSTGQVTYRDCDTRLKSNPVNENRCEKADEPTDETVRCECFEDLCNTIFKNSFKEFQEVPGWVKKFEENGVLEAK